MARFLELPDILGASPVVFRMLSYIGAFPFLEDAPAVLGLDQMIMVITIMTERYRRVLVRGAVNRRKLLFKSLAVYDRKLSEIGLATEKEKARREGGAEASTHAPGFAVDEAGDEAAEGGEDDDDDDELVLAAFDSLDIVQAIRHGDAPTLRGAMIPPDNFRKLIMLLLLISPLDPQESLSQYSHRVVGQELECLRSTAKNILSAFVNAEKAPGITFNHFSRILPVSFPFLFNGFNALFEHFLFSKNLDLNRHNGEQSLTTPPVTSEAQPLLPATGSILDLNILSQLSFFIPGTSLFRRLRPLFSGDVDGFSMGSFESKVFNWRAPTILLVRGTRVGDGPRGGPESAFHASLPPRRFGSGSPSDRLTFGVYVTQPWRHTNRECFGDATSILFQLEPIHDVFPASSLNKDYASFTKPSSSTHHAGISFGCPPSRAAGSFRQPATVPLGALSLFLDSSFEFGVFTHDYTSRGGAFSTSMTRRHDFQDRFEVESLEVWGCGGDDESKRQAEHWTSEAREAEARRKINLGTGDMEADRALLEMAGLIGANRNVGSMG